MAELPNKRDSRTGYNAQGDVLEFDTEGLTDKICMKSVTRKREIPAELDVSDRDKDVIRAGGKLAAVRQKQAQT